MNTLNTNEYFKFDSYTAFLANKLRQGAVWQVFCSVLEKIRKYTFISGAIKVFAFIVALLEKSAILLLLASIIFLTLPVLFFAVVMYLVLCIVMNAHWNKKIRNWITAGETVTVFITKERLFSTNGDKMFLRTAKLEASKGSGTVIIVCADSFISAKWHSENILAVKENYFFSIKKKIIEKNSLLSTYIVL